MPTRQDTKIEKDSCACLAAWREVNGEVLKLPGSRADDSICCMRKVHDVHTLNHLFWLLSICLSMTAVGWMLWRARQEVPPPPAPRVVSALHPGAVARLDSPFFEYSPGWQISPLGADPTEPDDPWAEPSGWLAFEYTGQTLALQLAMGNYWGYLYVTVDGAPANRLAVIDGNVNSQGEAAGYKPFLAPERQTPAGPSPVWVTIHQAEVEGPHRVEVEIWRSWGQAPIRAVAVDALPAARPALWPAVALGLLAVWLAVLAVRQPVHRLLDRWWRRNLALSPRLPEALLPALMVAGLGLGATGAVSGNWLYTDAGLGLLALAGLHRPALWTGALLFGLPFYLHPLPILPGLALNLVEIGVWGGLVLLAGHWLVFRGKGGNPGEAGNLNSNSHPIANSSFFLALLIAFALVVAVAAEQRDVALREWRTIFLAAGGFALLLAGSLAAESRHRAQQTVVILWLLGGTVVALAGLWQYASGRMLIEAEGVNRVRAFYGSPNNLALYLERTAAVGLALALFGTDFPADPQRVEGQKTEGNAQRIPEKTNGAGGRWQVARALMRATGNSQFAWFLTLPQLAALLLTFSKGALVLALPAILVTLGVGGYFVLRRWGNSLQPLWGLAVVAVGMVVGLLPFLGAERFRSLLDFSAGTTGGLRVNLWRSSWRMALDHPWLGVGPDNFLYAYRSGYILPAAWQDPSLNHPHNVVLDWWTRLGLPGLGLALGWLWSGVRRLWRGLQTLDQAALSLGCLGAIAGALAHGLIDASYALPDLMLVWVLLLGLIGNSQDL